MKDDIVGRILSEGSSALKEIYMDYREPFISWLVKNYACDYDDAMDIFQTTVIVFYENIVNKKLTVLSSSVKTYLFGIGKNKILEYKRKQNRFTSNNMQIVDQEDSTEDKFSREKRIDGVEKAIENLGEPCKSLLLQFYYHNKTINDLMGMFGYKNEHTTKNQKYKCLQRLRKMIGELNPSMIK